MELSTFFIYREENTHTKKVREHRKTHKQNYASLETTVFFSTFFLLFVVLLLALSFASLID